MHVSVCVGGGGTWHHASSVPEGVLLADVVADEALVGCVVEGGPQVAGGEHLALADLGGLLDVQPLAVVLEQELVAPWNALEGDAIDGARAVDPHAGSGLRFYRRCQQSIYMGGGGGQPGGCRPGRWQFVTA